MRKIGKPSTLASLAFAIAGCSPEVEHRAATQITARVLLGAVVDTRMTELRVRCFAPRDAEWESGIGRTFRADEVGNIVDVPFVPREGTARDRPFEIIAEALEGERVIAQARALVSFVPEEQRMREMVLDPCGERGLFELCEVNDECHGPTCLTCVEGSCAPTPVEKGEQLPVLDPKAPVTPIDEQGKLDAGTRPVDAGTQPEDASSTPQAPTPITCASKGSPIQCDDGNPCNGRERCDPTNGTALPNGCVAGELTRCGPMQTCSMQTGVCTSCETLPDGDGDGALSAECGGDDCDDTDPSRSPRRSELCDGKDNDCNSKVDDGSAPSAACMASAPTGASATCNAGRCEQRCNDLDADLLDGKCVPHVDCPATNPCAPGTCVEGVRTFTCSCPTGYTNGGKTCVKMVEPPASAPDASTPTPPTCAAGTELKGGTCVPLEACSSANSCTRGYPCAPTQSSGSYCVGELAEWPARPTGRAYKLVDQGTASTDDDIVRDEHTGLDWQRTPSAGQQLKAAQQYCKSLMLGGVGGWRVPSNVEASSLIDIRPLTRALPDPFVAPLRLTTGGLVRATVIAAGTNTSTLWLFNESTMGFGASDGSPYSDSALQVRCVRTNVPPAALPENRFDVTKADVVFDRRTSLTWERALGPQRSYADAKSHCDGLSIGGATDWRLPRIEELLTLISASRSVPIFDPAAFPNQPTRVSDPLSGELLKYWSASPDLDNAADPAAPALDASGILDWSTLRSRGYARCVR